MYMLSVEEIGRINTSADPLVRSTDPLFCAFGGKGGSYSTWAEKPQFRIPSSSTPSAPTPQPPTSTQPTLQYVTVWGKTASYLKQQTNVYHSNWWSRKRSLQYNNLIHCCWSNKSCWIVDDFCSDVTWSKS